ncbi:MAG: Zn-dependent oligopeptidase [Deltaproteobacteria bacterium]|nr:Zn-dependent oligopeptidase [Deltaproteobacteria bacterium]
MAPLGLRGAAFGLALAACSGSPPPPVSVTAAVVGPAPSASAGPGPAGASATALASDLPPLVAVDPVAVATDVASVERLCDENLALAADLVSRIAALGDSPPEKLSFEATAGRIDDALLAVSNGAEYPYLLGVAHPSEPVRVAARACESNADRFLTALWQNPRLGAVVRAYAGRGEVLDPERRRLLADTLRDLRRGGFELPPAGQQRLREINEELTTLGQRFIAEISASEAAIRVAPASLAGMPDAYVQAHPPGEDGKIEIGTDYPDYFPFVTYARDRGAARELYVKFTNRGGDDNVARLDRILALRHEKARLLGYATWADYAIEPRMAGSAATARAFLDRIQGAIKDLAARELAELRAELVRLGGNPKRDLIPPDRYYLTDRLRDRRLQLDSKELAQYFEIEAVTAGVLAVTARMYGLEYRRVPARAWHPEVTAYEVRSGGRPMGKLYLDLFSRPSKYKHTAMFPIRLGRPLPGTGVQAPVAALVGNFPRPGEPLPHDQVVTLFHELGHVLHHLLGEARTTRYAGTGAVRDFVETPSQMFEEWAWAREVLDLFARHRVSGARIPDAMFAAMTQARRVGLALETQRQIFLARLDLEYHSRAPGFDSTQVLQEIQRETDPFAYVKGTHFQSSFSHLIGYDAGYYGYLWALALAHDALTRFKQQGLLDPAVAGAWRREVLAKGGSVDERGQLAAFLGRPPDEQAYLDFLRQSR